MTFTTFNVMPFLLNFENVTRENISKIKEYSLPFFIKS